jgi:hypothetical protein
MEGTEFMTMPRHPDQDQEPASQTLGGRAKLLIAIGASLIVTFIVLHLAGVLGPG